MMVTIKREDGFHARPASELVKIANKYKSNVFIKRNNRTVSAKSILNLMSLAIRCGETIGLIIDGEDEKVVLEEILKIF